MAAEVTVRELVRDASTVFAHAGLGEARHEAEWLLACVTDATPAALYLGDVEIAEEAIARFRALVRARSQGAPLQYLVGWTEFYGRRFRVSPGVFIPRPETESVVEAALHPLRALTQARGRGLRLADLGTGSGAIAVTLACELQTCTVVAVELSYEAVRTAHQNALEWGVGSRVLCLRGRWTEALRGEFDAVISNPPYIASRQVDRLPLDVQQEPRMSVDGGADGLRAYEPLLRALPAHVAEGGLGIFECGEEQVETLLEQVRMNRSLKDGYAISDLGGRPRGIICRVGGPSAHG